MRVPQLIEELQKLETESPDLEVLIDGRQITEVRKKNDVFRGAVVIVIK